MKLESNFTIHVYNLIIFNFAVMCRSQWDEINNTLNTHALGVGSTNLNPLDLLHDNTTMKDVLKHAQTPLFIKRDWKEFLLLAMEL